MADKKKHLSHVKSKAVEVVEEYGINRNVPKLPTKDDVVEGEIAINFAEGVETISHKNDQGDIVTYPNTNRLESDEEIIVEALAKHETDIAELQGAGDDNEEVIAASINAIVGQGSASDVIEERKSLTQLRSELDTAQEDIETIDEVTASAITKIVGGDVETLKDDESLSSVNKSANTIDEVTAAAMVELYDKIAALEARVAALESA